MTAQSTGNYVLQLSLRTTDLHRARMLARGLTAESDRMLDGFRQATLNPAVASKWLRHVISSELTRVTESRAIIHADGGTDPDADWAMATAWQILARRGPNAELEEDDRATFIAEGRSPDALDQLEERWFRKSEQPG